MFLQQGAHLSPFGNLGNEEDGVLSTEIFTEARKGRSNVTKGVGSNDPEEDPAESKVPEAAGTIQERRTSEGNLEFKRNLGSPARSDTHSRTTKPSTSSDYSIQKSLTQKPARTLGRGSGSPMSEARATHDGIHSTPGRAHLTSSSRGDDHDKGVTVPKFGEWDDRNPASGEGYTQVFTAVREERQGIVRSGGTDPHVDSSHSSAARRANSSDSKGSCCGCCPWLGK